MTEIYIFEILLWLITIFSLTSGIVFVVYSLSGGKHEVSDYDRSRFDHRWDVFLGLGDGENSEHANTSAAGNVREAQRGQTDMCKRAFYDAKRARR